MQLNLSRNDTAARKGQVFVISNNKLAFYLKEKKQENSATKLMMWSCTLKSPFQIFISPY